MELRTKLWIDGEWVEGSDRFSTLNPATEEVIAEVEEAGAAEVDAAVRSARRAVEDPAWRDLDPHRRAALLWRLADLVKQNLKKKFQEDKIKLVDEVIKQDQKWRELKQKLDNLRAERNKLSLEINKLKKAGKNASKVLKEVKGIPDKIAKAEEQAKKQQAGAEKKGKKKDEKVVDAKFKEEEEKK